MVCKPCRDGAHLDCRELSRERDPDLHGGEWCYCQHEDPRGGLLIVPVPPAS